MNEDKFVKRVYDGKIKGNCVRGRPSIKLINRVDAVGESVGRQGTECAE